MSLNAPTEVRLDSPDDWDDWENALLNQAETYDLLGILQGTETSYKRPKVPLIEDFMPARPEPPPLTGTAPPAEDLNDRIGAAAGTRRHVARQSAQGTTASQSTESGDPGFDTNDTGNAVGIREIEKEAWHAFTVYNNQYKSLFQVWEIQRRDIDKVFTWIKKTVCLSYLKTCVSITPDWKQAYQNLKAHVGQGTADIQKKIKNEYDLYMRPFRTTRPAKEMEAWIVKWDELLTQANRKSMMIATDTMDWSTRFFDVIRNLDHAWVSAYEIQLYDKIDNNTLEYKDLTNLFRRLIQRLHSPANRQRTRVSRGSFTTHKNDDNNDSEDENTRHSRRLTRSQERTRRRSRSYSNEPPRKKTAGPEQERTTPPFCPAYSGRHFLLGCFYILQYLSLRVPENFVP
ncbi:hypothetical protein EYB25_005244 [Talaromyces marneffei]|nr:hypothetical protein EYB25_005244 [Talaromyces marneffei]